MKKLVFAVIIPLFLLAVPSIGNAQTKGGGTSAPAAGGVTSPGPAISNDVLMDILKQVSDQLNIPVGKLLQMYNNGDLIIIPLGDGWYRVIIGGLTLEILTDSM